MGGGGGGRGGGFGGGGGRGGGGHSGSSLTNSPLILDMNRDGVISADVGLGIRIDVPDTDGQSPQSTRPRPAHHRGAAVGGDKMLAMCDFVRDVRDSNDDMDATNGEVDIREVFGDRTHDPFDPEHRPLHAPNGFVALRWVAERAQQRFPQLPIVVVSPSSSSSSDSSTTTQPPSILVQLKPLRQALRAVGCDLGLLSGDNVRHLEPFTSGDSDLGDNQGDMNQNQKNHEVIAIEVGRYRSTPDDRRANGIEDRQRGHYVDACGHQFSVDDLWFPAADADATAAVAA